MTRIEQCLVLALLAIVIGTIGYAFIYPDSDLATTLLTLHLLLADDIRVAP